MPLLSSPASAWGVAVLSSSRSRGAAGGAVSVAAEPGERGFEKHKRSFSFHCCLKNNFNKSVLLMITRDGFVFIFK